MTRGQNRCYIYCEDKTLSEYLKRRINWCEITNEIDKEENYRMMIAEETAKYFYNLKIINLYNGIIK